jgi:hypothetical protein
MIDNMGEEDWFTMMENGMKGTFLMIEPRVKERSTTMTAQFTKEIFQKTSRMEEERKLITMDQLLLALFHKVKNSRESFYGQMDRSTLASLKTTKWTVWVFMNGLMVEDTMESGKRTKWMEKEPLTTQTEDITKAHIEMIRRMEEEFIFGPMEGDTKVNFTKEDNMAKVHFTPKTARNEWLNLKTDKG